MPLVVAIHQPNFFPWLGYFDKIAKADTFIFLDDVQFSKTGGSWCNRVKIIMNGEPRWVTASVERSFSGTKKINEMNLTSANPWRNKFLKSLEANYRRANFYKDVMTLIEPLIMNPNQNLAEYNIQAIKCICDALELKDTVFLRSSQFGLNEVSNELLSLLTEQAGGDVYLSGAGSDGYLDPLIFEANNLKVKIQQFTPYNYPQLGMSIFVPGLSILDLIMNVGLDEASSLILYHARLN